MRVDPIQRDSSGKEDLSDLHYHCLKSRDHLSSPPICTTFNRVWTCCGYLDTSPLIATSSYYTYNTQTARSTRIIVYCLHKQPTIISQYAT